MKDKLYIFSNNKINNFLTKLLSNYELIFLKFEEIDYTEQYKGANIVIVNCDEDAKKVNFKNLNKNYLIITNLNNEKLNLSKNIDLLNAPIPKNNIKNKIENFLQNIKVHFFDISIENEKLTNLKNKSFCYLTKAELEILTFLIREKETTKNFIKENILKIKSNVETNSLESHLTRIRKKMNEIETIVKIQTKNDRLIITT